MLLGLAVLLIPCTRFPLTRAEAMYALIPKEMLAAGTWLTPTLNGVPYLDKPPLLYWLNMAGYLVFGVSEHTARIPTLLIALGELWFTYLIGVRLLNPRAAWLGSAALLTCIGFFAHHLQLLTDHLISLTLLAALYALLRWQEAPARRWAALFFGAMAAGFLSKGFIALSFPALIGLAYAWQQRQRRLLALLFSPLGISLALLLIVPWLVLAEQASPGTWQHQIVNEQIMRFLGQRQPPDITPFPIPAFWFFLGLWLMPWTLLLPQALYRFWRTTGPTRPQAGRGRLLLIWPAAVMLFFTAASSRIEYYSLPALPALALIVGWRLDGYLADGRDRTLAWLMLGLGLLGATIFLSLPFLEKLCADNRREFIGLFALVRPAALMASLTLPMTALLGAWLALWRPRWAVGCYLAMAGVLVFLTYQAMAALSPLLSDRLTGEYVRVNAGPQDVVVMEAIEEFEYGASLAFYSGRGVLMVQRLGLPQFPYPVPREKNYLISPEQLAELWRGPHRVYVQLDDVVAAEPYLADAHAALTLPGKRLLVNRP